MSNTSTRLGIVIGLAMFLASAGIGWTAGYRIADKVAPPDPHPPLALMRR